ncbi:MAG: glycine cleavage system protein GcvH [Eubacteriales bacterium]|nr:glycine cleavage system protein GcvH [Eubacteriales bacterium]
MSSYEVRALPLYTKEHTWMKTVGNGIVRVGITDYAQKMLKEINYAELPSEGDEVVQMESCAELESTKAVSQVYCPVSGTVAAVNEEAMDEPSLINQNPYDAGWLIDVEASDLESEKANLMTAEEYKAFLDTI